MNGKSKGIEVITEVASFVVIFLLASLLTSIPLMISGFGPLNVFYSLLIGGFGSIPALARTLIKTTPILFCGLGLLVAFRCGVWNIGAEGQLYIGALGATVAGLFLGSMPSALHIIVVCLAGFAGGALWAGIAGFLRVRYGANEMIVTLLMNFIAFWIISYMVRFPLRPELAFNPVTAMISESARLPIMLPGTSLHIGILIAIFAGIIIWFILGRTVLGYRIRAVGSNSSASAYGGISVKFTILVAMLLSGGLAGLAGMNEVCGVHYLLSENISFSYGYLGIPAALIGRLNPIGTIISSLFIGSLFTGGRFIQTVLGIPYTIVYMIVAVFILAILVKDPIERGLSRMV
jgi:ABC-type uncharacterized transport system permease subunit